MKKNSETKTSSQLNNERALARAIYDNITRTTGAPPSRASSPWRVFSFFVAGIAVATTVLGAAIRYATS